MGIVAGNIVLEKEGTDAGENPLVEAIGVGYHLGVQDGGNEISHSYDGSV